ncbi:putative mannitol dehydrogenase [Phytophthora cinnamomi]|uniref:putative mannitol dehydrogenase n=1 Tax=Phytophthora cinnamomi TaxID=4785 RepID=UPI00355A4F6E|nr:putative mannitol dehydrogenase [Phytophthora cinnamomi]
MLGLASKKNVRAVIQKLPMAKVNEGIKMRLQDDADLARMVFKNIQEDGGVALTNFSATTVPSALLKEGSVRGSVEVLEYARERKVHVDPVLYAKALNDTPYAKQYADVLLVWDAMSANSEFDAVHGNSHLRWWRLST